MSKFTPSPQEVALVNQIFTQADAQKIGVVTGEAAVKIFSGSKLPPSVLAEVWNLADDDHKGVLTRKDVAVAVRLLGHAQRGERVSEEFIHKPGAVPSIEGLNVPVSGQGSGGPKSPPPGSVSGLPPLTPQDKIKFMRLFTGCGPVNGLLPGDKARDVFVKSKLPVDKLSQIWTLADSKNRGVLDATDFTIAMYLIQASMSGQLQVIPQTLPPYLYDQAKPVSDGVATHPTGGSGSFSPTAFGGFSGRPVSVLQPQFTGQSQLQPQMTGQRPILPAPSRSTSIPAFPLSAPPSPQVQWDVTPAEKANADQFFSTLDTQKKGYIEGDVAVPFMVQSKLPDEVLAQIWDLADLNNDGRLTREGFAVAMHLIQGKLGGKDVPATLPPSLVPPSMRAASPPAMPPRPSVPEPIKDLIWDETPPQSATTSQAPAPVFPPAPKTTTVSPQHTAQQPVSSFFSVSDPFTSTPFSSGLRATSPPVHKDLLTDDDEPVAHSPPLQDKSAEIGNVQNQLHSTNRALGTTKNERADLERKLAEQATQLSALQTQLSSAKAAYETENRLLATLRERFSTQSADIQKTRQELIRAESDLSAVRVEKAEVEGSVLRDKEEVRELQRKMTEVGSDVEMLKAEIEKAKKEAKQQKGLLAIAKKQLATREAERAKVAKELEDAKAQAQSATKEREQAEAELAKIPETAVLSPEPIASTSDQSLAFAAAQPLPASPEPIPPASPAMSAKSTNPFERLTLGSQSPPSRSSSPFVPLASAVAAAVPVAPAPAPLTTSNLSRDPFSFEAAFGGDEHTSSAPTEEPPSATTEASQGEGSPFATSATPAAVASAAPQEVASPAETDHFLTPPTTATVQTPQPSSAVEEKLPSNTVEKAPEGKFPDISGSSTDATNTSETDLSHRLQELEVEESDSDSDDEPLNAIKAKLQHDQEPSTSNGQPTAATGSAFDDSFGISSTSTVSPATVTSPVTTSLTPQQTPAAASPFPPAIEAPKAPVVATSEAPSTPEAPATVSDFDEALGKLSGSGTSNFSHVSQFTFESAFEDDFDFAAAKAATASSSPTAVNGAAAPSFPPRPAQPAHPVNASGFDAVFLSQPTASPSALSPAPAVAPALAPHPFASPSAFPPAPQAVPVAAQPAQSRPFSFDDVFGAAAAQNQTANNVTAPAPSSGPHGISFDDAFGGMHTSDALALDTSFSGPHAQPSAGSPPPGQKFTAPFPSASSPSSPVRDTSFSSSSARSPSPPPRTMSPPPRHVSPRPRPSTGSSDKEKSTRHSKLSIRLPFGRKKAKQQQHDPMPSHLSQSHLVEEPFGNGATPPAEDDIDAVKTLCSMGFSRTQAVSALEQHDYDVQRALNSLLGTR